MQFSTTPTLEGQTIVEYCGVVTGEAILGANIFRDFFAGIRDIVGGRSGAYEKELRKAREIAFEELGSQARALGADAVVGIDIDYETVGQNGSPRREEESSGWSLPLCYWQGVQAKKALSRKRDISLIPDARRRRRIRALKCW